MKNKIERCVFFACVFFFLTNCKSETDVNIKDNQIALKEEIGMGESVSKIDEQQKMVNSDFQKFAREAEEKTNQIEKLIFILEADPKNTISSSDVEEVKRVNKLYERCKDLKIELKEYVQFGNGNWGTFKTEYYKKLKSLQSDCI